MAKRHGQEFWRRHLEGWRQSDLTQREYCATQGLGEKAFYRWRRKEREAAASVKSLLTLVPVSVGAPVAGSVVRLHSDSLPATRSAAEFCRVHYSGVL
jgi:hypothetical protein